LVADNQGDSYGNSARGLVLLPVGDSSNIFRLVGFFIVLLEMNINDMEINFSIIAEEGDRVPTPFG